MVDFSAETDPATDPDFLRSLRRLADCSIVDFAALLNLAPELYAAYEDGTQVAPRALEDAAFKAADDKFAEDMNPTWRRTE